MIRALVLLLLAAPAGAVTTISSDLTVTGEAGFGTFVPRARLDIAIDASDGYALKVSSQNGDALLSIDREGNTAIGLGSAGARLDVADGDIGLQLRAGNSSNTATSSQFVFALAGTQTFRHGVRTGHDAGQFDENRIDFYLWNSTGSPNALGGLQALSLRASSTTTGSVQVLPAGPAPYELVVSDGETIGGGTIQYGELWTASSRERKEAVRYLEDAEVLAAYEELKALRHVLFRYAGEGLERAGLIYEDAPESIRGTGAALSASRRLALLEMAMREAHSRLDAVEASVGGAND